MTTNKIPGRAGERKEKIMNINEITVEDGVRGLKPLFNGSEEIIAQKIIKELEGFSMYQAENLLNKCIVALKYVSFLQEICI